MYRSVKTLRLSKLRYFPDDNGNLVVIQGETDLSFVICRVFIIDAPDGAIRGRHAHLRCSQYLVCSKGSIEVVCDDGEQTETFVLNRPFEGLLVPPGIWSEQIYRGANALLTVLCDRPYEVSDYVRDYKIFKELRHKCR